jgi:argininosuccinate lyase
VPLDKLTLADLKTLHSDFEADVDELWSYEHSAESRDSAGGSSRRRVLEQIAKIRTKCIGICP